MNQSTKETPVALTQEQLTQLVTTIASAIGAEMRKPTELEQRKIDEENAKAKKRIEIRMEAAKRDAAVQEARRKGCPHADERGQHGWVGQVNSDGYWRPLCKVCGLQLPAIKATEQQQREGLNLNLYKSGLSMVYLLKMAAASPRPDNEPGVVADMLKGLNG